MGVGGSVFLGARVGVLLTVLFGVIVTFNKRFINDLSILCDETLSGYNYFSRVIINGIACQAWHFLKILQPPLTDANGIMNIHFGVARPREYRTEKSPDPS